MTTVQWFWTHSRNTNWELNVLLRTICFLFYFHHDLFDELRIVHLYMMQQNLFVDLDYP